MAGAVWIHWRWDCASAFVGINNGHAALGLAVSFDRGGVIRGNCTFSPVACLMCSASSPSVRDVGLTPLVGSVLQYLDHHLTHHE